MNSTKHTTRNGIASLLLASTFAFLIMPPKAVGAPISDPSSLSSLQTTNLTFEDLAGFDGQQFGFVVGQPYTYSLGLKMGDQIVAEGANIGSMSGGIAVRSAAVYESGYANFQSMSFSSAQRGVGFYVRDSLATSLTISAYDANNNLLESSMLGPSDSTRYAGFLRPSADIFQIQISAPHVTVLDAFSSRTLIDDLTFGPVVVRPTQPIQPGVSAFVPWSDTFLNVAAGQRLTLIASGCVQYGPNLAQSADANGVGGQTDGTQRGGVNSPAPEAIAFSLIGKIGGTTSVGTGTLVPEGLPNHGAGFVGAAYSQVVSNSGRLFLGYNDAMGQFFDNRGFFFVAVWTSSPTNTTNTAIAAAVEICWPSATNKVYVVQYAPAMDTNRWTDLGVPVLGNGTTNCVFDSTRGRSKTFYRVLMIP